MHPAARNFVLSVKCRFPDAFTCAEVLDCGSLDINGCNRPLFDGCEYMGIDVGEGRNVDEVSLIHEFRCAVEPAFDTIISTECFEHDAHLQKSLANIVRLLKPGGLFVFTCAHTGRNEHGTTAHSKTDSPLTPWEHYENVTREMVLPHVADFASYEFSINDNPHDLYFWGIK